MNDVGKKFNIRPISACAELLYETTNGGAYRRPTPVIVGPRRDWVKKLQSAEIGNLVESPKAEVYRLRNATIWGEGVVTTDDRFVIAESLVNVEKHHNIKGFSRTENPNQIELSDPSNVMMMPERTFIHAGQSWDANYGHWLMDCWPRVVLAQRAINASDPCCILNQSSPSMRKVMLDSLAPLGITERQTYSRFGNPIRVGELIYTNPMTVNPWIAAPFTVRSLSALGFMLSHTLPIPRPTRIYVNRRGTRRNLINQDALSKIAADRGYTVISPAKYSLAEQAALFSQAQVIIGAMGAELVNTVFSPPGVTLMTLSSSLVKDDYYWNLASLVGGRYIGIHGEFVGNPDTNADFSIDPKLFEIMLDQKYV